MLQFLPSALPHAVSQTRLLVFLSFGPSPPAAKQQRGRDDTAQTAQSMRPASAFLFCYLSLLTGHSLPTAARMCAADRLWFLADAAFIFALRPNHHAKTMIGIIA